MSVKPNNKKKQSGYGVLDADNFVVYREDIGTPESFVMPVLLVPVFGRLLDGFFCGRHVSQRRDSFPTASLTTIPLGQG
jgi:hypothetical protein